MLKPLPLINGLMTLTEQSFNIIGYLPKKKYPSLHAWGVTWRKNQGLCQLITGLALLALGCLLNIYIPDTTSYFSFPMQMASLGALFANHGAFNLLRACVEHQDFGCLTLAYDFYGQKVLPAFNPRFDLSQMLFTKIRTIFNRLVCISIFPPEFIFK